MMGVTHAAAGAFAGALVGLAAGEPLLGAGVGAIAGLLPDIDHPGSLLGRRVPILAVVISALAGHRGITHTVWFCAGIAVLAFVLAAPAGLATAALVGAYALAGGLSHLPLDGLTLSGVTPFAPVALPGRLARFNHIRGPVRTGTGLIEGPASLLFTVLTMQVCGII
ncbi:MAG: metal-dependent hydrolase [Thermoanaerobacterales bacterium]|nr:metal-dependent hydrolase [Thermoanaerobacterales bacterium]